MTQGELCFTQIAQFIYAPRDRTAYVSGSVPVLRRPGAAEQTRVQHSSWIGAGAQLVGLGVCRAPPTNFQSRPSRVCTRTALSAQLSREDDLAARIRAARAYAGLTRQQLAEAIERPEITDRVLARFEDPYGTAPKPEQLRSIANACGLPESFFTAEFQNLDAASERSISDALVALNDQLQVIEASLGDLDKIRRERIATHRAIDKRHRATDNIHMSQTSVPDFRTQRQKLPAEAFALHSSEGPEVRDLVDPETWRSITSLPDDVSLLTSEQHGQTLRSAHAAWSHWPGLVLDIQRLSVDISIDPLAVAALNATDEFQASVYAALTGFYRQAIGALRPAIEAMLVAVYFKMLPDRGGFAKWLEGSAPGGSL